MSAAGALGLFNVPGLLAAEGPLETTSVRLLKSSLICSAAPQFAAEALLRAEGFKEIAYVEVPRTDLAQAFSNGIVDFTVTFAVNHIQARFHYGFGKSRAGENRKTPWRSILRVR